MSFEDHVKSLNLENDYEQYKKDGVVSYNLEVAVCEYMVEVEEDMNMFKELKDNGDPSELVSNFLMEEDDE